jgi:hypothetical protein
MSIAGARELGKVETVTCHPLMEMPPWAGRWGLRSGRGR